MGNSKDLTKKFLEKASEIRAFDLETSSMSDPKNKNIRNMFIKDEVNELSDKYVTLESPEKEYLESIKNFYGLNKYDYSTFEKGRISLDTPTTELDFSVRALNTLKRVEMDYLGEVVQTKKSTFLKFRKCGLKTLGDIEKVISKTGYKFGMDIDYVRPDKRK